ncbi:MAG: hypothetical protein HOI40_08540, partial [Candidatus Marinimicrobia bacterium]|nr:hypothetical protein [Candidatus Neomarinimicrobiota bacterium]
LNQQNQIDIMSGSLANLIQEVQKVQNSFSAVEDGIESNKNLILDLTANLKSQTDELATGMEKMLEDLTKQIKTINNALEDQDNNSLRARKKISTDLNDFKNEFSQLKNKFNRLNSDVSSFEGDLKSFDSELNKLNRKVDNIPTKK